MRCEQTIALAEVARIDSMECFISAGLQMRKAINWSSFLVWDVKQYVVYSSRYTRIAGQERTITVLIESTSIT
jgi:hypothetical protein